LDVLLSHYEFHTEASSLYLQELDLPHEFRTLVQQHESFFANEKRIQELKAILEPEERESSLRLKMLSIVCACDPDWDKVLYALFAEAFKSKNDKYKSIQKFSLDTFFWETIEKKYNYKSPTPAIKDFLLRLVQDNFEQNIPAGKPTLNKEAFLFVNRWKENVHGRKIYNDWISQLETDLSAETSLQTIAPLQLLETDTFPLIDKKIILALREYIVYKTWPDHKVQEWIEKRRDKFFFTDFANLYEALSHASALLDEIRKVNIAIKTPEEGFEKYEKQWFKLDRLYRKYIYFSEQAEHQNILKELTQDVEKAYGNTFLLKLGDTWQSAIASMPSWKIEHRISQRDFYKQWVAPYIEKENRVFVIISDALRFESATELRERILQEDRFTATLTAVVGVLPSYTQLGMASLLPHVALSFNEQNEYVFADGISTQGTSNRTKVLQKAHQGSIAIGAEDFLKMKASPDGREFIKPYNVVYIYSNHIDKTGDDRTSEGKVFEATETEFEYLLRLLKHINNMNGYNMIITSDHGHLYQHNRLDETDFTAFSSSGTIYKESRRFVLGKNLVPHPSVKTWSAEALGFADDTEAQIPNSINRIRIQGAGSRFVHGGSALQEIVVPVLEINKARKSDVGKVEVDIISGSSIITSNTTVINFYQKQPVMDKILPRQIRAGFYDSAGRLISNVVTLTFNVPDKDAMAREKKHSFIFTAEASQKNGQDVYLKLEEPIEDTNQFKLYKSITYRMLIAFKSEFDDF
jgi:uncharacterized protein (TIGR02687 family)